MDPTQDYIERMKRAERYLRALHRFERSPLFPAGMVRRAYIDIARGDQSTLTLHLDRYSPNFGPATDECGGVIWYSFYCRWITKSPNDMILTSLKFDTSPRYYHHQPAWVKDSVNIVPIYETFLQAWYELIGKEAIDDR